MLSFDKLSKLLEPNLGSVTYSNIDDYFVEISNLGIEEVEVLAPTMDKIVRAYLASVAGDKDGGQGKVIRENRLDKYMGVKVVLVT